ncbi:MAG: hypothetical protein DWQ44_00230 [Bacteroidetes bacterium]|nr:MAG: hypothetical protein DWQ33_05180 [Bacteroidota bacterium]REK06056.1 MAG: hypothetical protein DWQ39_04320 [Bacteroidota bacterium]REK37114.1 MAG: hypothetical protein DWQ44_00230 [Bacteroidota bacterium]
MNGLISKPEIDGVFYSFVIVQEFISIDFILLRTNVFQLLNVNLPFEGYLTCSCVALSFNTQNCRAK